MQEGRWRSASVFSRRERVVEVFLKFLHRNHRWLAPSKVTLLVRTGKLRECGLDPKDPWHFVEVFKSMDGAEWRMAIPDHAFRGYLKKVH